MPLFRFYLDHPVGIHHEQPDNRYPTWSYLYEPEHDLWRIPDPKSGQWIVYDALGVPEAYRAQVLLLTAAYE